MPRIYAVRAWVRYQNTCAQALTYSRGESAPARCVASPRNRSTAIAWHTSHITAVVAGDLADQGEAQANTTLATLTHAGGTVEGGKDTFPLRFLAPLARGRQYRDVLQSGTRGSTEASTGAPAA